MWTVIVTLANGQVDRIRHDTRESARFAARWYRTYTTQGHPRSVIATRVLRDQLREDLHERR